MTGKLETEAWISKWLDIPSTALIGLPYSDVFLKLQTRADEINAEREELIVTLRDLVNESNKFETDDDGMMYATERAEKLLERIGPKT